MQTSVSDREIPAVLHPSGFTMSDANFYSLICGSDDKLYYTLSSHNVDQYARVFCHDPEADAVTCFGDFGEITGESRRKAIPQGKSHSPFFEMDGCLYMATHYGFYAPETVDGREQPGTPPEGYDPYPGGHFLRYDLAANIFTDLVRAPTGEGILTMNIDRKRRRLYGLTWPKGFFIYYDIDKGALHNLGPVSRDGELGFGDQYQCLCRSFGVVPDTGMVYFTNATGEIRCYDPRTNRVSTLEHESLRRDILGPFDPHKPGHQGFNWRVVEWHEGEQAFYGVHAGTGYLFRFDPATERLDLIERICPDQLRRNGRFEPFRYGYLSFAIGPNRETVYYLSCCHGLQADDGRPVDAVTHLITFNLRTQDYQDHGVLRLADGRYPVIPQTLVVHPNGLLYSCPWIEKPNRADDDPVKEQVDLISFADPLASNRRKSAQIRAREERRDECSAEKEAN